MITTIGYERADLGDFVATLQIADVEMLVDVRDRAQSRRTGFSKTALAEALNIGGIAYLHVRELGDPKEGREAARRGDFDEFRRIFSQVMSTKKAMTAINLLEGLNKNTNICLMCYERDYRTCHRKIVSDKLEKITGKKTQHLGVKEGAGRKPERRRMSDSNQSSTAQIEHPL